jgi:hypothetical protein
MDTGGLAAMIGATRGTHWPLDAPGLSEAPGQLQAPRGTDFVDPTFIGPMEPVQQWNNPIHMRRSIREGMMDMQEPVAEDEYRALIRRLWESKRPL